MKPLNLKDLQSEKPQIKYCCAKQAIALSEKNPKILYPDLETFINFLDGENNVLRWMALIVIGNLSPADEKGKITKLVPRLIQFTKDKSLITAGNAAKALGKISKNKPGLKNNILTSLLAVEKVTYYNKGKPSPECRNVVIGHVIGILAGFNDELKNNKRVIAFLKRQTKNRRPKVKELAQSLLNKIK